MRFSCPEAMEESFLENILENERSVYQVYEEPRYEDQYYYSDQRYHPSGWEYQGIYGILGLRQVWF